MELLTLFEHWLEFYSFLMLDLLGWYHLHGEVVVSFGYLWGSISISETFPQNLYSQLVYKGMLLLVYITIQERETSITIQWDQRYSANTGISELMW
jgi:hypothetical protein